MLLSGGVQEPGLPQPLSPSRSRSKVLWTVDAQVALVHGRPEGVAEADDETTRAEEAAERKRDMHFFNIVISGTYVMENHLTLMLSHRNTRDSHSVLFWWLPAAVFFSHTKSAPANSQPAVLFFNSKLAPAINHNQQNNCICKVQTRNAHPVNRAFRLCMTTQRP